MNKVDYPSENDIINAIMLFGGEVTYTDIMSFFNIRHTDAYNFYRYTKNHLSDKIKCVYGYNSSGFNSIILKVNDNET